MVRKTVLIIKHGFREGCEHSADDVSGVVSLGDVFRCTCLLEDFKGYEVTWITAPEAKELLAGNHLIDELILAESPGQLPSECMRGPYHTVINLEKRRDWCEYAAAVGAEVRYGFRDWRGACSEGFYAESAKAVWGLGPVQESLFKMVGRQWSGQRYVLGYRPRVAEIYDVGLNHHVGPKWPTKAWPQYHWQRLYYELSKQYNVCWQQSLDSIRHYIDWLASCRLIVTCDSLGLHLGLGLNKQVVGLFGPTAPEQIYMYGCGIKLTPTCDRSCLPCYKSRCDFNEDVCMEYISVEQVYEAVEMLLGGQSGRGRLEREEQLAAAAL